MTSLLYVGTKGKYYEVSGLQTADVENLLATVNSGKSVGSLVGKLFSQGVTVLVEWSAVLAAVGAADPSQPNPAPSASSKAKKVLASFADFLLPQARSGLFSFNK